jgi:hypothetical protein
MHHQVNLGVAAMEDYCRILQQPERCHYLVWVASAAFRYSYKHLQREYLGTLHIHWEESVSDQVTQDKPRPAGLCEQHDNQLALGDK